VFEFLKREESVMKGKKINLAINNYFVFLSKIFFIKNDFFLKIFNRNFFIKSE